MSEIPEEEIQRALLLVVELRNMQGTTGRDKAIHLASVMREERERAAVMAEDEAQDCLDDGTKSSSWREPCG